eukprot:TRINITY_DN13686_c0_g1_i1.p1 TRINITY_DN13686_c0_g1~~TRINITY_DN13686_c0_g1_i1.p1  ORF type:complete len:232 (+),score=48.49 TRINITY_DN13686_c0_g1_i1:63-758(+)
MGDSDEITDDSLQRRLQHLRAEQEAIESEMKAPSEKALLDRFQKLAGVPAASTWSRSDQPSQSSSPYDYYSKEHKSEEDEVLELLEQVALEIKSDAIHSQPIPHVDSLLLASHYIDPEAANILSKDETDDLIARFERLKTGEAATQSKRPIPPSAAEITSSPMHDDEKHAVEALIRQTSLAVARESSSASARPTLSDESGQLHKKRKRTIMIEISDSEDEEPSTESDSDDY